MAAAHGLACRESAAKSQTASRSWRLTAQRKPCAMRVPDRRVTGATPGQPGQRFGVGEAGPAVADLGEQPGGAYGSGPGQRGEDVPVGVGGQLPGDLGFQGLDLGGQRGQRGGQGRGDACLGGAVGPGGAGRGGLQPSVQLAVQLHVNAADLLVRRGKDRDDSR